MGTKELAEAIEKIPLNTVLLYEKKCVAFHSNQNEIPKNFHHFKKRLFHNKIIFIKNTWDLFSLNHIVLKEDFKRFVKNKKRIPIPKNNFITNEKQIFIEENAEVSFSFLNAESGPIYIGKGAKIMEGSFIRGPVSIGENTIIKMGAKIYGGTTLGPYCKIGGEVNNSIIMGFSNKGHEGFLGNSVVGHWCNFGAGTEISNMKNNYSQIKLWNYNKNDFEKTGLQFCGLMMGDYSKCGINTMFNTGTVVGVNTNIYGSGYMPKFIPNFSFGGVEGWNDFKIEKAFETAKIMMERIDRKFTSMEKKILTYLFKNNKK